MIMRISILPSILLAVFVVDLCGCSSADNKKTEPEQQFAAQNTSDDASAVFAHHPVSFYLAHPQIPQICKDLYVQRRSPMDNNAGITVGDSLATSNKETAPFYFLTMTRMLKKANGAVAEEMGFMAKAYLEQNLLTFLKYFTEEPLLTKEDFNDWATAIAAEIQISAEGEEQKEADKMSVRLKASSSSASPAQKQKLEEFTTLLHSEVVMGLRSR
jgi:hypothetical protein